MKVALITGAANGIGLALSLEYLQKNCTVMMVDKDEEKLKKEFVHLETQYPGQLLYCACDITQPLQVKHLLDYVKSSVERINWLYNNAGIIGQLGPIWDINPHSIQKVMEVNVLGMLHIIQAFIPFLFQQDVPAHIVNMASLYALCTGSQTAAYAMSKHAVLALSESLYFDLQSVDKPVAVSVVFPSFTDTALLSHADPTNSALQEVLKSLLAHSRPAADIAAHIVNEVEQNKFYIFPDKEVKGYCEERTQSLVLQERPHRTNIEKLMNALIKRQKSAS